MNSNIFRLDGKIALVTGASYGIGMALAKALASAGAKIVFNDIKQDMVESGIKEYKECGIDAKGYVFDVTDEKAVGEYIKRITDEVGVVDILVNNAGIIRREDAVNFSEKDWDIFYAASKTHNTASMRNLPLVSSENIGRRREGKPSKSAASRRGLFFST